VTAGPVHCTTLGCSGCFTIFFASSTATQRGEVGCGADVSQGAAHLRPLDNLARCCKLFRTSPGHRRRNIVSRRSFPPDGLFDAADRHHLKWR